MKNKNCPRCGKSFVCMPENINQCQCRSAHLSVEERDFLKQYYSDCLCINCLLELKRVFALEDKKLLKKYPIIH